MWAPRADAVELVHGSDAGVPSGSGSGRVGGSGDGWRGLAESSPMTAVGAGWFVADGAVALAPGSRYGFRLDGDERLRPDPRGRFLPGGATGPSEVVDPGSWTWTDEHWNAPPAASLVIYEVHIGTFTAAGTFLAAIDRLDALVDLGVNAVELMPLNTFPGRFGWGYDGVGLWAPHPTYGRPEDLARFVDEAHRRGLAVVLDVVHNHLGPEGNELARFGPYFTDRFRTPWGDAVNLDGPGSDDVRAFFIESAVAWLRDYHLDGLRLDAVHELIDRSARPFLAELVAAVRRLEAEVGRHLVVIAENDTNDPRLVRSPDADGYGLDAAWADDLHHAVHVALTGERDGYYADYGGVAVIVDALEHGWVYRGGRSPNRGHRVGVAAGPLPPVRFVVSMQNHDQVGNRPTGERFHQQAGDAAARVARTIVLLSPFVPMLFQGEEWHASTPWVYFADHLDPDLREAVRRGRREELAQADWDVEIIDPESVDAWRASVLDWDERDRSGGDRGHADHLRFTRALVRLRRSTPDLADGRPVDATWWDEERALLAFRRGSVVVVAHLGRSGPEPVVDLDLALVVAELGRLGGERDGGLVDGGRGEVGIREDDAGAATGGPGWRLLLATDDRCRIEGDALTLTAPAAVVLAGADGLVTGALGQSAALS